MEIIDGSDGVTRSAIARTNDGIYKRPVVKLCYVLPERKIFAIENQEGHVEATLYAKQMNSLPNQEAKLE